LKLFSCAEKFFTHSNSIPAMSFNLKSLVNFCFTVHALSVFALSGAAQIVHAAPSLEIRAGGTGSGVGPMRILAQEYAKLAPDVTVSIAPTLGSSGGIKAMQAGALELALTGRPLNDAEKPQGFKTIALGRTPAVFGVQAVDPLTNITSAKLVEWLSTQSPVGASGVRVRIVLRPHDDGDTKIVRSLSEEVSAAMTAAQNRPGMIIAATDKDAADAIERTPGAIGLTSLGQVLTEQRKIKVLKLNGVEATPANAINGSYPLVKTLYVSHKDSPEPHVKAFVVFLSSPAARTILAQYGYYAIELK
jgi:phosphate transport system substrate-binding protein